jgi:hypothetical protein
MTARRRVVGVWSAVCLALLTATRLSAAGAAGAKAGQAHGKNYIPPAAKATLNVTPGALGTPWTFEVTNDDATPLRVVTDGRLLSLDVTAPPEREGGPRASAHCSLPAEVRPTSDEDRVHVLAPGETYVEVIDPRFYCFSGHDAAALIPGAEVVAHLGWKAPSGGAASPPFEADESFGGNDRSGVKELTADQVTVPDSLDEEAARSERHKVQVTAAPRIDVERGDDLELSVTVENTTNRTLHLLLRPETLAFDISSPRGVYACRWRGRPAGPIAEVFTTIGPHAKASSAVLLSSMCPDGALDVAGLYTVQARLDTRRASGKSIGIDTFDAVVDATAPTLVRVRHNKLRRP